MYERPAVYLITHRETGRVYVGSTANLSKRWSRHRQELRDGIHRNKHLQAAWSLYGADAFDWTVLAVIEPSERIALEQRAIDHYDATDPDKGFNRAAIAGVSYGGGAWERTPEWRHAQSAVQATAKASVRLKVGDRCPSGHVIDGTYVRRRKGKTGVVRESIRCQECARVDARNRFRRNRGIPEDWPKGSHFNRRR